MARRALQNAMKTRQLNHRTEPTELVIFDCDGVLIDSEIIVCRLVSEELTGLGYWATSWAGCRWLRSSRTRDLSAVNRQSRDDRLRPLPFYNAWSVARAACVALIPPLASMNLAVFPGDAGIKYNLACFAAQAGDLASAKNYLREAVRLNPDWRNVAGMEADLKPIWREFSDR